MTDLEIDKIVAGLSLEEKCAMIHGAGLFRTAGVNRDCSCGTSFFKEGIPSLVMSDGPMGVRNEFCDDSWDTPGTNDDFVSYLPSETAIAATWNEERAFECGDVLGSEARGRGKDMILAPGVNIMRTPLCGRNFEYLSEDPFLTGRLAVSIIKGIQKNDVSACVKHFALNNQETQRSDINSVADIRSLNEIYFPAFRAAVREGKACAVMCAYNRWQGVHCSENKTLLEKILRDEWNFDGVVVSDWGAVHSTKAAAENGTDIEMDIFPNFDDYHFAAPLVKAVREGSVSESVVDAKVKRILRLMQKLNIQGKDRNKGAYNTEEHRRVCLNTARESVVLLKNEGNVLPIDEKKIKTVTVIGYNADAMQSPYGGSAAIKALYEITPLAGIKMYLGGNTRVRYCQGYGYPKKDCEDIEKFRAELHDEAVKAARESDCVIFVGGTMHYHPEFRLGNNALSNLRGKDPCRIDSEGFDRDDIKLPLEQDALINDILDANANTVIVISSGNAVDMSAWSDRAKAIVQTWYNGMEGGRALAEVLFGKINPSGKLPFTVPKKLEDCPAHALGEFPGDGTDVRYKEGVFVGYRYFSTFKKEAAFCFGHGLSYTKFEYSGMKVKAGNNNVQIKFNVKNCGNVAGAEVAQVYVGGVCEKPNGRIENPSLELRGFCKKYLLPGESAECNVTLDTSAFEYYSEEKQDWVLPDANRKIFAGSSVEDIRLEGEVSVAEMQSGI